MSSNGYLTSSELAPIAGGGQLAKPAAAAWNAMAAEIKAKTGQLIRVNGPDSSYRPYSRQVYWRNYWCGQGHCENAAVPGTSNHGWGLAVDVPTYVQSLIASHGAPFGWQKQWSDASWEPWHFKYAAGHYSGPDPGPDYAADPKGPRYPTLKRGSKNKAAVKRAQKLLAYWNFGVERPDVDGTFGKNTRTAVVQFQVIHDLKPVDGVIGPKTWKALRRNSPLYDAERTIVNRLKLVTAGKNITDAEREKIGDYREWCAKRAHAIHEAAEKTGWDKEHRRQRFAILHALAGDKY